MKSLILCSSIILSMFSINSQEGFVGFSQIAQKKALELRELLSEGKIRAYQLFVRKDVDMRQKDIRKEVLSFIDKDGNNILHFLVRLQRFKSLYEKFNKEIRTEFVIEALEEMFVEEMEYVLDNLDEETFIRLLEDKNNKGLSPLQEAQLAQGHLESDEDWKKRLSSQNLHQRALEELSKESTAMENRGLAYQAFQTVVSSLNSNMRPVEAMKYLIGGGMAAVIAPAAGLYVANADSTSVIGSLDIASVAGAVTGGISAASGFCMCIEF